MLSVIKMNAIMLSVIKMSVIMLRVINMNAIMLSVIMLSVIMLNVIMVNVVAPFLNIFCWMQLDILQNNLWQNFSVSNTFLQCSVS